MIMKKDTSRYLQVRLELKGFDPELLSGILFQHGCLGIEELNDSIWFVYFPEDMDSAEMSRLLNSLRKVNPGFHPEQFYATVLPDADWNAEWKKHFHPLQLTERIWVAPPWEVPRLSSGQIQIIIDPQMAFGTGSHETTQLMVQMLEKYLKPGYSVLDAGTGSGILALLAAKLGAREILGFDIEPEAIDNAQHNAQLNQITGIEWRVGGIIVVPEQRFDLVLANINRAVLLEMLPELVRRTARMLILSGILIADEYILLQHLPPEVTLVETAHKNEWSALVLERKDEA